MTLVSLPRDDVPPSRNENDDRPPLRCEHDGCPNTLTYAGRGRKPKFCDEHKPNKPASDGTSNRGRGTWAKGDAVERNLTKLLNWSAAGITFINAKDGTVIAKGGPAVAHELVELARADKSVRPYLEWLASPGKYGPLIFALASVLLPLMVNHGMLPQFILPILELDMTEGGKPNVE